MNTADEQDGERGGDPGSGDPESGDCGGLQVWLAGAVLDAGEGDRRVFASPGVVVVKKGKVLAAGSPEDVSVREAVGDAIEVGEAKVVKVVDLGPDGVLLPGMVNAHSHLELTSIGPVAYGGSFMDWVGFVMQQRPMDAAALQAAIEKGVALSRKGGVVAVGDIGPGWRHEATAWRTLQQSGLSGVAFGEVLGLSQARWQPDVLEAKKWVKRLELDAGEDVGVSGAAGGVVGGGGEGVGGGGGLRLGLQAHAPYTTCQAAFGVCADWSRENRQVLAIHAAELLEEQAFVAEACGDFRERFEQMGFWSEQAASDYGQGLSPIQWLKPVLTRCRCLLAHCNYVDEADLELLAKTQTSVVYCPIASAYYGHPQQGREAHRYQQMLDSGINVCLGTDSILCQLESEQDLLGLLPAMRLLYRRDGVNPMRLLEMATVRGARALGLSPQIGTWQPHAPAFGLGVCCGDSDELGLVESVASHGRGHRDGGRRGVGSCVSDGVGWGDGVNRRGDWVDGEPSAFSDGIKLTRDAGGQAVWPEWIRLMQVDRGGQDLSKAQDETRVKKRGSEQWMKRVLSAQRKQVVLNGLV